MAGFKNLEDLVGDLEAGLKKLRAGALEPEELSPLVVDARELYDRLTLLRFKAHEFSYEVRRKWPEGGVDANAADRQPVRPFRIGAAYQTSLIDAIEEVSREQAEQAEAERMAAGIWKDKCPGHLQLTLHYLKALIANRKWDEVKRVSQQAMGYHGQTPNLVTIRGQCMLYTGQIPAAKQCFQKVLREDPDYKPAQVMLKSILKVDRAKLAANELYKEGKYAEVRKRKSVVLMYPGPRMAAVTSLVLGSSCV